MPGFRRRFRRRFCRPSHLAAVLAAAMLAAACAPPGDRSEVVFWAMGAEAEIADRVLDGFREAHPDVPVRVQQVPWSAAHEKLLTAFVGGSMPDVFQIGNTWIAELATVGALDPLDARASPSPAVDTGDFFEGALEPNRIAGRLVALPWYVDTRILFYRRDLLAEAGAAAPPRTWEEWRSQMTAIRDASSGRRFGAFFPIDEWQTPVLLALGAGATLLRDDDGRGNFRSDEARRAFGFYAGLFADGLAPRGSDAQLANLYREFADGYFTFVVTGPWNLGEMKRRLPPSLDDAWTTAPIPAPDDTGAPGVSVAGGASLAISSTSKRKDAAWQVVEYLLSAPVQQKFREASGDLPSRRSAWSAAEADARAAAFRTQLDHLAATPKVPEWERIAARITLHLERVVRAEVSLDQALADLDEDVDAILAKRRSLAGGDAS